VIVILVVIQYGAFNIGDYKNSGSGLDLTTDSVHDEHSPLGSAAPIDEEDDSSLPHTTLQGVRRFRSNLPRIQRVSSNESEHVRSVRVYRQQAVKDAFKHTWEGYSMFLCFVLYTYQGAIIDFKMVCDEISNVNICLCM
jgi:hypothetical protein